MADKYKVPQHRQFKGAVDATYLDSEDSDLRHLAECTNLTPFRKAGSLQQTMGTAVDLTNAQLPQPSGFRPVDLYYFSLDKDSKIITVLTFTEATGGVKIYIKPYWNPIVTFSNHDPNQTGGAWIDSWLEVTEYYSDSISSTSAPNKLVMSGTPSGNDDYYKGWFIVNLNLSRGNRYNYVTAYDASSKEITCQSEITTPSSPWVATDTIKIYRFPVCHLYSSGPADISEQGVAFTGLPTQYIYKENAVRMPCGRFKRPLILEFIQGRKYFLGQNEMSYEGFWFDFQSIPQVMNGSAITAFGAAYSATADKMYLKKDWTWSAVTSGDIELLFTLVRGNYQRARVKSFSSTYPPGWQEGGINWFWEKMSSNLYVFEGFPGQNTQTITFWVKQGSTIHTDHFVAYNPFPYKIINITSPSAGNMNVVPANLDISAYLVNGSTTVGQEFGGNTLSQNPFAGTRVEVTPVSAGGTWVGIQRHKFIINAIIDNRSQILIAHGTFRPRNDDVGGTTGYGMKIEFTPWFSRRITGLNVFNIKHDTLPSITAFPSMGKVVSNYPFFQYVEGLCNGSEVRINEVPQFSTYSIHDFQKVVIGNSTPYGMDINLLNITNGTNAYTFSAASGYWYVNINKANCGWDKDGVGLKYISACDRYIDQDTTMNYTRGTFVGQTNGRFFIALARNEIELDVEDINDRMYPNIYASGVSEYDTFLRDRNLSIVHGDKDQVKTIENSNGLLAVIKDNNAYTVDVMTKDEVDYVPIDTNLGRGCSSADEVVSTIHGIVLPTVDGVWLLSRGGLKQILRADNARLQLYKDYYLTGQSKQAIYYSLYDEVYLISKYVPDVGDPPIYTYMFVYNFASDFWTVIKWEGTTLSAAGVKPIRFAMHPDRSFRFINYHNLSNFNICRGSEGQDVLKGCDGSTSNVIQWTAKTHLIPYAGRIRDFQIEGITFFFDANCDSSADNVSVEVTFSQGDTSPATSTFKVDTDNNFKGNLAKDVLLRMAGVSSMASISISNVSGKKFSLFNLNSFFLWLTSQERQIGSLNA